MNSPCFGHHGHLQASTGEHLMAPAIPWISVFRILMADGDGHESMVPIGGGFNWNKWCVETGGVFCWKMVWYLAVGFCSSNLCRGENFWKETLKDGEFVCLKLGEISGVVSQPPTNQNRDSIPCRMIILRRCEPTNVRWDHLGLGKCSRRLRFVGVSWCHQSVSRFF